ncbi:uncharacterized protein BDZ99DRAFT_456056 [Mytilinidion resinicola]|uniref:18S rRNA factor 2 n=1 Tax=Mytilinidion resinicola TaxID=574789 RepID=A0A6A6Y0M5_9PEZI|nr:uncharacterized protein BDZ99DRAFT_456056 [Mytilinidion resinicola]KAF2801564.1 hypothetical protein BDZ99DRAFT_456056 [Mytilinidion resinicola]
MATRKRNEWLEAEESDDDEQGYDSAEESKTKALPGRAMKRRKVDDDSNEDLSDNADDAEGQDQTTSPLNEQDEDVMSTKKPKKSKLKPLKTLSEKKLLTAKKARALTGVIYLSRVPPFMKPSTVKHLLSQYGDIGRIFLAPEDPASHTRRVKAGGNKKRSFTEGWIEFIDKKNAKLVAETLNAEIIGGKKGGWYHDDLWNIKYLKNFKWDQLTEQINNENAERAARLRAEIGKTTRENKMFLENVERAKMLDGIAAKRKKKADDPDTEDRGFVTSAHNRREFRQITVKSKSSTEQGETSVPLRRL